MKRFKLTAGEFHLADEESEGRCIACGAVADCVEPDARRYVCEECEAPSVYGMQELLLMGRVEIVED